MAKVRKLRGYDGFPEVTGGTHTRTGGTRTPEPNTPAAHAQLGADLAADGNSWTSFLGRALSSGSLSGDSIIQLLELLRNNPAVAGTNDDEIAKQLYEMILKQWTTDEQRKYDQGALQEQRTYDSPTNQLARLMGAGISRDAAIQMLQGGQDPALVGSGSQSTLPEHHSPLETPMQIANTALGFVGTVGQLVGLGFSVPASIQQAKYLNTQNLLLGSQKQAYESAGRVFSIFTAAGSSAKCFQSLTGAVGEMTRLSSAGNADAKQFISDGGMAALQSNASFSVGALSKMYQDNVSAERADKVFNDERAMAKLNRWLLRATTSKTWQDLNESVARVREIDSEIDLIATQIAEGKIRVLIGNEEYKIAKNDAYMSDLDREIVDKTLYGYEVQDENGDSKKGIDLLSYHDFCNLFEKCEEVAAGVKTREQFREYCMNNQQIMYSYAVLSAALMRNRVDQTGADRDPAFRTKKQDAEMGALQIMDLLRWSGLSDVVRFGGDAAVRFGLNAQQNNFNRRHNNYYHQ